MNAQLLIHGVRRLAAIETAPYEELAVRTELTTWLKELKLPVEIDAYGNTWVRLRRGHPRRQSVFVAHLDHPALRVEAVQGTQARCRAEGGLPTVGFKGSKVVFPRTAKGALDGRVASVKVVTVNGRDKIESAVVHMASKTALPAVGDFAVPALKAFAKTGQRLKLRVADDLAGCTAIVGALSELAHGQDPVDVLAIFTRAEEVGFHGALAVAVDGRVPRDSVVVSVECSRAYGDVVLGGGPVVRLGDRAGPFDPRACALVAGAARDLAKKKFPYQTALMAGGTCEATAFVAFGYLAAGIAIPLNAYHNQAARTVAPEEIDVRDLEGAARLIAACALRAGGGIEDLDMLRNDLILSSQDGRERLREPIDPITGYPKSARF